jgi:hypothetical protein
MPFHLMLLRPRQDRIRGELGAIVGHDHLGLATRIDERSQLASDAFARDRGTGDRRQAFARRGRLLLNLWQFIVVTMV